MDQLNLEKKFSVLLADDDRLTGAMISKILKNEDYDVTYVENGQDAINCAKANSYDYLITDIIMPEVEGIEVISEVLECQPNTKIIAISSDELAGHSTLLTIAQTMGASATIKKPIRPDTLIETIKSI